jgi:hypothetical protein
MKSLCLINTILSILILLIPFCFCIKTKKVCLSPENKAVDWYVLFLFPSTADPAGNLKYGYFDNESTTLTILSYNEEHFPGLKVIPQFLSEGTNYFFWNDDMTSESGDKSSGRGKAHSKGGLFFDDREGVLLSHSLPRFPWRTESGDVIGTLPPNAGIYGQTFICLSLDATNALKVVESLNIINPALVLKVDSDSVFSPANDNVEKLIKNRQDSKLENTKIIEIQSRGNSKFKIFSKSKNEESLPWDSLIPKHYSDGFYVETWTKPDLIESSCTDKSKKIFNVQHLKFGDIQYTQNQEHSKWAVGIKKNIACFGDLNRTGSQMSRAGNTICFEHDNLANIMRSAIVGYEDCRLKFLME